MTDICLLSSLSPQPRCPECRAPVRNMCVEQDEHAMNGLALWTISQQCSMCPWSESHEDVKIGA